MTVITDMTVFYQLVSGQRSVTFDDSCSVTSVESLQHPRSAASTAAGDVPTCCNDATATNWLSKYASSIKIASFLYCMMDIFVSFVCWKRSNGHDHHHHHISLMKSCQTAANKRIQ